ncbi:MAG: ComEC/Rec2 family competence protein [Leptolyngbyaceae bacterium]|nr:ComEC/Rec2 family competence protein [Leptolyngbyaceae bacterium]
MVPANGIVLCLAYILGLLSTVIPWKISGMSLGGVGVLILGIGAARIAPQFWRTGPKSKIWLIAGVVGLCASLYLQGRVPQPSASDISRLLSTSNTAAEVQVLNVTVQGRVTTTPRLTRSQKLQFWLAPTFVYPNEVKGKEQPLTQGQQVTGKLYVTTPLMQATGLRPGQAISVSGTLYQPKPALNPGGFDFQAYLAQEGGFAGLKGLQVTLPQDIKVPTWGWWSVRQKILRSQLQWLDTPEGLLISSMVLGGRVVDLPYDIRDQFAQIGLAHALAASGFQTSLILGAVLTLASRLSSWWKFGLGFACLLLFLGLTGIQPAVLRAVIMGTGALIALVMERKVRPLNSLLLAATLLLLFDPLWIWNLGFQLSLLATMGLLVTVTPLSKYLDWLPPLIAVAIAVPIAAYIWTLPLQLYAFGIVSPYSILVNVITTPLISAISLGGFVSAIAALIWPMAGSATAWLLYFPAHWLIAIVNGFSQLPGSTTAVGTISVLQLILLYGLIGWVWLKPWWHRRWWAALMMGICLVAIPAWQAHRTLFRVTVLAASEEMVSVIQDKGRVALINSGNETTARLTVLPFLQQQGINQVDWGITTDTHETNKNGWLQILGRLPIKTLYEGVLPPASNNPAVVQTIQNLRRRLQSNQGTYQELREAEAIEMGSSSMQAIAAESNVWQLDIHSHPWLCFSNLKLTEQNKLSLAGRLPQSQVLWWTGEPLSPELLEVVQPEVAIASASKLDPATLKQLQAFNIRVYWTGRDGALQWTPQDGFEGILEPTENNASLL